MLEQQFDTYERTVYSFFDMFGFLGGIAELFRASGFIVISFFTKRSFYSWMLSRLYQVESTDPREKSLRLESDLSDLNCLRNSKTVAPKRPRTPDDHF
mmetsp:Transcript_34651/g.40110  ORF Transcript_34651/g.40110 Transcript_34651/m.40110 type:complete len:98 (+) Transcript_34651:266-559(+)